MVFLRRCFWKGACLLLLLSASCKLLHPTSAFVNSQPVQETTNTVNVLSLPTLPPRWTFTLPPVTACPTPVFNPPTLWQPEPCELLRDSIILFAKQHIGKPYRHAGKGPKAFDCSGFTSFVMRHFGYYLPPSSAAQATFGTPIDIAQARKGDLIFFGNKDRKGRYRINHAALVISEADEELTMIHAARRGITIEQVSNVNWQSYYGRKLVGARRIIHEGIIPPVLATLEWTVAENQLADTTSCATRGVN